MINSIILVGRLTREVEVRYTTSNKAVANFSLAVNRQYKNAKGEYDTDFINIEIWGNIAETLKNYCNVGDLLGVSGNLRVESYEKDGQKKYRTYVLGNNIHFLTPKKKEKTPEQMFDKIETDPFQKMHDKIENDLPADEGMPW